MQQLPEIGEEEFLKNEALTYEVVQGLILPPSWSRFRPHPPGHPLASRGCFLKGSPRDGLIVAIDAFHWKDGKPWIHVSCSRKKRMPSYEDLVEMKAVFIGPDRQAVQVFPKKSEHVNIHNFCLHLWCCLAPEGDGLPNFGEFGTI